MLGDAMAAAEVEERYRAFFDNSTEGIWRFDTEEPIPIVLTEDEQIDAFYRAGYLGEANDVFARMYGFSHAEELIGTRLGDLLVRDDSANDAYLRAFIRADYRLRDAESVETDREGNRRHFSNTLTGVVEDGKLVRAWGTQRDITPQKVLEEALRQSEERFRAVFEQAAFPVVVFSLDGRHLMVNQAAADFAGYTREEMLTLPTTQIIHPDQRALLPELLPLLLAEDGRGHVTLRRHYQRKDGSERWGMTTISVLRDAQGKPTNLLATNADITELVVAEAEREAVRAATERSATSLRLALESGRLGSFEIDLATRQVDCTEQCKVNFGLAPGSSLPYDSLIGMILEEDRPQRQAAVERAVRERGDYAAEYRILTPSGEIRWIAVRGRAVYGPDGTPLRMIGVTQNITQERESAEALRASEVRYRELFESHPQALWVWDTETGGMLAVNDAALALYGGYTREEFLRLNVKDLRPAADLERFRHMIGQAGGAPQGSSGRWRHYRKDGSLMDVEVHAGTTRWGGRPARVVAVQDITDRLAAERAKQRAEERYGRLLETAREGILFLNALGKISHVNPQFVRMLAYDHAEELIGQEFSYLFFPDDQGKAREKWAARLAGVQENYELRLRARDNTERWFIAHVTVERDEETEAFLGTFTLLTDITERRRIARELASRNEEIATVFERVTDAFAAFDTEWNFVYLNSGAERILGRSRAELIGKCIWDVFEGAQDTPVYREYLRAQRDQVPVAFEVYYGQLLGWFEVRAYPSPTGLSAYFRDISERKRAEVERERAAEERAILVAELQEANARQRRFLKEMLAGFTEGRLRLCFSADDLPAALPPRCEPLELSGKSLRRLRQQLEAVAEEQALSLERLNDFETAVHEAAMNAVKYGGGGTARVHGDPLTGVIQVWVMDGGPGIAEDLIHRAVERGYTTAGFGHGMFFMQTCADRLYLLTGPMGTTVVLEMDRIVPEPAWFQTKETEVAL